MVYGNSVRVRRKWLTARYIAHVERLKIWQYVDNCYAESLPRSQGLILSCFRKWVEPGATEADTEKE